MTVHEHGAGGQDAAAVLDAVTRRYGSVVALDGVTFEVPDVGLTALTGRPGSGKTTVLRLIAGLDTPDAGTVEVAGPVGFLVAAFRARPGAGRPPLPTPRLLLSEEPSDVMPAWAARRARRAVRDVADRTPVLAVTHDAELAAMADTVIKLDRGRVAS